MTFEEWRKEYQNAGFHLPANHYSTAKDAWDAANRAARKECAEICDAYAKHNSMHRQHAEAAADCADEIRESIK